MATDTPYKIGLCDCGDIQSPCYISRVTEDLHNVFPGTYYLVTKTASEIKLSLDLSGKPVPVERNEIQNVINSELKPTLLLAGIPQKNSVSRQNSTPTTSSAFTQPPTENNNAYHTTSRSSWGHSSTTAQDFKTNLATTLSKRPAIISPKPSGYSNPGSPAYTNIPTNPTEENIKNSFHQKQKRVAPSPPIVTSTPIAGTSENRFTYPNSKPQISNFKPEVSSSAGPPVPPPMPTSLPTSPIAGSSQNIFRDQNNEPYRGRPVAPPMPASPPSGGANATIKKDIELPTDLKASIQGFNRQQLKKVAPVKTKKKFASQNDLRAALEAGLKKMGRQRSTTDDEDNDSD